MFDNARYLTRGVNADIPLEIQLFLWGCIDQLPSERDYLPTSSFYKKHPAGSISMLYLSHTDSLLCTGYQQSTNASSRIVRKFRNNYRSPCCRQRI